MCTLFCLKIESRTTNRLEANNIDEEELELQRAQTFIDEEGFKKWLLTFMRLVNKVMEAFLFA